MPTGINGLKAVLYSVINPFKKKPSASENARPFNEINKKNACTYLFMFDSAKYNWNMAITRLNLTFIKAMLSCEHFD